MDVRSFCNSIWTYNIEQTRRSTYEVRYYNTRDTRRIKNNQITK